MAGAAKPQFGAVPVRAFSDIRLRETHFRVLGVIAAHDRFSLVKGTGQGCTVPSSTIAKEAGGRNASNVSAAISELVEWGFLRSEKRAKDRRRRIYRVIYAPPDSLPGGQTIPAEKPCPEGKLPGEIVCPGDTSTSSNSMQSQTQYISQSSIRHSAKQTRARGAVFDPDLGGKLSALAVPPELWLDFREHRRRLGAAMTDPVERLILARLAKLQAQGHGPVAVVEQSMERGWRGVFPLKPDSDGSSAGDGRGLFHATRNPRAMDGLPE